MESTNKESTSSPNLKNKRNYFQEYLPLYKKAGDGEEDWKKKDEKKDLTKKNVFEYSKPNRTPTKWQKKQKETVDTSQTNIDGSNLSSTSAAHSTPRNVSKVTSTPLASGKKSKNKGPKNSKKDVSLLETNESITEEPLSQSKSQKRSKSVSFLLEENDQAIVKKPKSDVSNDTETDDTPRKIQKKKKKNKKAEKENLLEDTNTSVDVPMNKNKRKSDILNEGENSIQSVNDTVQTEKVGKDIASKKHSKNPSEAEVSQVPVVKKKAKKQKHQDLPGMDNGEPVLKSFKTDIANNLENLNLGDNPHTLTDLINDMTVVDKAKKKKAKKEAKDKSRDKTEASHTKQKEHSSNETVKNVNEDGAAVEPAEPKKWVKKHWNKKQKAEYNDKKTLNIDNLPVTLLKTNFKKILIDHFSEYGVNRGVGEPHTVNEEVFTVKIHFDSVEAAIKALERDGSTVAGHEIRVSAVRPKVETHIVIHTYGAQDKLTANDIQKTYQDIGFIRCIKLVMSKKKTLMTVFVEFDGPKAVEAAMKKSVGLIVNGVTLKVDRFKVENNADKKKNKKKNLSNTKKPSKVKADANSDKDSD